MNGASADNNQQAVKHIADFLARGSQRSRKPKANLYEFGMF